MTYTFKLSRRLAVLRPLAGGGALCVLYACAPGENKGNFDINPPNDTTVLSVVLNPHNLLLDTTQTGQLLAFGRRELGDSVPVILNWRVTGGSLSPSGAFHSSSPGSFLVIGQGRNSQRPTDTAAVTVVTQAPTPIAFGVSPQTAAIGVNQTQVFTARASLSDGTTVPAQAIWTATGGSIDGTGVYVAGSTPGNYLVAATEISGTLADTAYVTVTAAPPTLQAVVLTPGSATLQTNASLQFSAAGLMSNGSTTQLSVVYSATGGTVNSAGNYRAGPGVGRFRVIARANGGTLADTAVIDVTSTPPVLQQVTLTPSSITVAPGATRQFTATGLMSDGNTSAINAVFTATGGAITSGGLYTAGSTPGTFEVIARVSGGTLADTAVVTIATTQPVPVLQQVILTPASVSLQTGNSQQFSASGRMSDGSTTSVNVVYTETGGSITAGGLYTAGSSPGTFQVIARESGGTLADTATVTITPPPPVLQQVILTPASVSLQTGNSQQFSASGRMSDGSTTSINVVYTETGGSITAGGLYTAGSTPGTFHVIARLSGGTLADTALVTITAAPPVLQAVVLSPASASIQVGATRQFSATGRMSDGSTTSINVVYTETGGSITANGLYTAGSVPGTFQVIARESGGTLADTAVVTITTVPPVLQAVVLTPPSASVQTGNTRQFSASGQMSDGSTASISVVYSATGGSITAGGLYTAGSSTGTFHVIARESGGALADTAVVTITAAPPVLQAVVLTPASASIQVGATHQFSASGRMSDGSTTSINVVYTETGGSITAGGLYTAGSIPGTFHVIARESGGTLADTAVVTITAPPPVLQAVVLTPASASVQTGNTRQFSASGRMSDGSTTSINVVYTETGGSITAGGLYTAGSIPGTFHVIARESGGTLADTAVVTITAPPPVLQAVVLTPASTSVQTGNTQQFSATGRMSDGSTTSISVVYSATGGSITTGGFYTAGSTTGTFRVIAREGGGTLADTSVVTITSSGGGGGGGGATLIVNEDFSTYTSTANMIADPRGIYHPSEDISISRAFLDQSVGYGGSSQSMRYDLGPAGCGNHTVSRGLKVPNQAKEVWLEVVARFSSNFSTLMPASMNCPMAPAYKFVFGLLPGGGGRFDIIAGIFGNRWDAHHPGTTSTVFYVGLASPFGSGFDGRWHVYRFHWKVSATPTSRDGAVEIWMDGAKVVDDVGINTDSKGYPNQFYIIALGRNINNGPYDLQQLWWGRVQLWSGNPGW